MEAFPFTTLATVAALLVYFFMGLRAGAARSKFDVPAPAMSGHPIFERRLRIQLNTLEWLVIFLPMLWLFALAWGDLWAGVLGGLWALSRIVYMLAYEADPARRGIGFTPQALVTLVLLGGVVWAAVAALIPAA